MRDHEIIGLQEAYLEVCEEKDETEEGITGLPIPKKKMSPAKRHEFEKKRNAERKKRKDPRAGDSLSINRMTGSRGHGSEYKSTRSVREEVLSYLLDEGFASDEKSAEAIMGAMSEAWVESIVEAVVSSTGQINPPIKAGPMFPKAPNMGANRPYEDPFINPSGSKAPKGASTPVKKNTKTA
jgi:hypothetical protein